MKTTKKFLSIILAILMIASSVPFAFAADTTLQVGDTFEADLTEQGPDNLSFRYVFEVLSLPEGDEKYGKLELVKPAEGVYPTVLYITFTTNRIEYEGVKFDITSIGDEAFMGAYYYSTDAYLTEVNFNLGTVENIGTWAFYGCDKLEKATLSPYVDKFVIGEQAFVDCWALTKLSIDNGIGSGTIEIGEAAFSTCKALTEINIDRTVSKLDIGAFIGCSALKTVTFEGGGKLTEIPGWCFANTALESIAIPEGVTAITGEVAFYRCYSLRNVELPATMETVVDGAFYDCPLERVVFKGGEAVEFGGDYPIPLLTVENGFGDGLYANGQQVTITANEKEGFAFTGWEIVEGDGNLTDATASETVYTMGSSTATLRPVYEDIRTECEKGNHEFVTYEESEAASCGKNAKETATCENCTETHTREIADSALTHSFTNYEEVTAPECGVAGKEIASCDNGCGETDEREIPALTHKDTNGDYLCDYDCGHEFENPAEPDTSDTPDVPTDEPTDIDCDHICHSDSSFTQFFWKIIRFLQKLFGIQQYCDCGVAHW